MISSRGTDALVALEDRAPDCLFEVIPRSDHYIWPLLRWPLAQTAAETELRTSAVRTSLTRAQLFRRTLQRMIPNRTSSTRIAVDKDFLFIVGGGTIQETPSGRVNWLVDSFANSLEGRAVVLQDRPMDLTAAANDRPAFSNTYSFDDALGRIDWATKLAPLSQRDARSVENVIRQTFHELEFPVEDAKVARTVSRVLYRCSRARHVTRQFQRVLDRVKPKIVFLEDGSYGDRSNAISEMKQRGILVVEPQHGWIGPAHAAYNFGGAMRTTELSRCLPDVLLTFGEFWSSMTRYPAEVVAIGKPHLESMTARLQPLQARPRDVLVVSSVYDVDKMVKFTLDLRDSLPTGWRVLFRPHPSERASATSIYKGLVGQPHVAFDQTADVNESLALVRGVVGVASTVLYEALAFECKVFVIDSPLADLYAADSAFGTRIANREDISRVASQLAREEIVPAASAMEAQSHLDSVWKPNAVENFHRFVERVTQDR